MSSLNRNIAIAAVVVVVILAIFSFKKFVMDAGAGDSAKAKETIDNQIKNLPATDPNTPPPTEKPDSSGIHQPGNKGGRR